MAFDTENIVTACKVLTATRVVELAAHDKLKISAPQGTELVDERVPSGKKWAVTVRLEVHETNE